MEFISLNNTNFNSSIPKTNIVLPKNQLFDEKVEPTDIEIEEEKKRLADIEAKQRVNDGLKAVQQYYDNVTKTSKFSIIPKSNDPGYDRFKDTNFEYNPDLGYNYYEDLYNQKQSLFNTLKNTLYQTSGIAYQQFKNVMYEPVRYFNTFLDGDTKQLFLDEVTAKTSEKLGSIQNQYPVYQAANTGIVGDIKNFVKRTLPQLGFTLGTIGGIMAQEVLLAAATSELGGTGGIANIATLPRQTRNAYKLFGSLFKSSVDDVLFGGVGRVFNNPTLPNVIKSGYYSTIASGAEANIEAYDGYSQIKDLLISNFKKEFNREPTSLELNDIEDTAIRGGKSIYRYNKAVLSATNLIPMSSWLKPLKGIQSAISPLKLSERGLLTFNDTKLRKLIQYGLEPLSEGLEEYSQEVIKSAALKFYTERWDPQLSNYNDTLISDILELSDDTMFTPEGQESFLAGAFIGGLSKVSTSGVQDLFGGKKVGFGKFKIEIPESYKQTTQKEIEYFNNYFLKNNVLANITDAHYNYNLQHIRAELKKLNHLKENELKQAKDIEDQQKADFISLLSESNRIETFEKLLDLWEGMSIDELKKLPQFEKIDSDTDYKFDKDKYFQSFRNLIKISKGFDKDYANIKRSILRDEALKNNPLKQRIFSDAMYIVRSQYVKNKLTDSRIFELEQELNKDDFYDSSIYSIFLNENLRNEHKQTLQSELDILEKQLKDDVSIDKKAIELRIKQLTENINLLNDKDLLDSDKIEKLSKSKRDSLFKVFKNYFDSTSLYDKHIENVKLRESFDKALDIKHLYQDQQKMYKAFNMISNIDTFYNLAKLMESVKSKEAENKPKPVTPTEPKSAPSTKTTPSVTTPPPAGVDSPTTLSDFGIDDEEESDTDTTLDDSGGEQNPDDYLETMGRDSDEYEQERSTTLTYSEGDVEGFNKDLQGKYSFDEPIKDELGETTSEGSGLKLTNPLSLGYNAVSYKKEGGVYKNVIIDGFLQFETEGYDREVEDLEVGTEVIFKLDPKHRNTGSDPLTDRMNDDDVSIIAEIKISDKIVNGKIIKGKTITAQLNVDKDGSLYNRMADEINGEGNLKAQLLEDFKNLRHEMISDFRNDEDAKFKSKITSPKYNKVNFGHANMVDNFKPVGEAFKDKEFENHAKKDEDITSKYIVTVVGPKGQPIIPGYLDKQLAPENIYDFWNLELKPGALVVLLPNKIDVRGGKTINTHVVMYLKTNTINQSPELHKELLDDFLTILKLNKNTDMSNIKIAHKKILAKVLVRTNKDITSHFSVSLKTDHENLFLDDDNSLNYKFEFAAKNPKNPSDTGLGKFIIGYKDGQLFTILNGEEQSLTDDEIKAELEKRIGLLRFSTTGNHLDYEFIKKTLKSGLITTNIQARGEGGIGFFSQHTKEFTKPERVGNGTSTSTKETTSSVGSNQTKTLEQQPTTSNQSEIEGQVGTSNYNVVEGLIFYNNPDGTVVPVPNPKKEDVLKVIEADIKRRIQEDKTLERGVLINFESKKPLSELQEIVNKIRNNTITEQEIVNLFVNVPTNTIIEIKQFFNDGTLADKIQFGIDVSALNDTSEKKKDVKNINKDKQIFVIQKEKAEEALRNSEFKIVEDKDIFGNIIGKKKVIRTVEEQKKYINFHTDLLQEAISNIAKYDAELKALESTSTTQPINTKQAETITKIEKLQAESKKIKLDKPIYDSKGEATTESLYSYLGKLYIRVSNYIKTTHFDDAEAVTNMMNGATVGNFIDIVSREFFKTEGTTYETLKELEIKDDSGKIVKFFDVPGYKNLKTEKNIDDILQKLNVIRTEILSSYPNAKFFTEDLTVLNTFNDKGKSENKAVGVAGTMDLIVVDNDGKIHLYDFKNIIGGNEFEVKGKLGNDGYGPSKKQGFTNQLKTYIKLLKDNYDLDVTTAEVIIFPTTYSKDTYKGAMDRKSIDSWKPQPKPTVKSKGIILSDNPFIEKLDGKVEAHILERYNEEFGKPVIQNKKTPKPNTNGKTNNINSKNVDLDINVLSLERQMSETKHVFIDPIIEKDAVESFAALIMNSELSFVSNFIDSDVLDNAKKISNKKEQVRFILNHVKEIFESYQLDEPDNNEYIILSRIYNKILEPENFDKLYKKADALVKTVLNIQVAEEETYNEGDTDAERIDQYNEDGSHQINAEKSLPARVKKLIAVTPKYVKGEDENGNEIFEPETNLFQIATINDVSMVYAKMLEITNRFYYEPNDNGVMKMIQDLSESDDPVIRAIAEKLREDITPEIVNDSDNNTSKKLSVKNNRHTLHSVFQSLNLAYAQAMTLLSKVVKKNYFYEPTGQIIRQVQQQIFFTPANSYSVMNRIKVDMQQRFLDWGKDERNKIITQTPTLQKPIKQKEDKEEEVELQPLEIREENIIKYIFYIDPDEGRQIAHGKSDVRNLYELYQKDSTKKPENAKYKHPDYYKMGIVYILIDLENHIRDNTERKGTTVTPAKQEEIQLFVNALHENIWRLGIQLDANKDVALDYFTKLLGRKQWKINHRNEANQQDEIYKGYMLEHEAFSYLFGGEVNSSFRPGNTNDEAIITGMFNKGGLINQSPFSNSQRDLNRILNKLRTMVPQKVSSMYKANQSKLYSPNILPSYISDIFLRMKSAVNTGTHNIYKKIKSDIISDHTIPFYHRKSMLTSVEDWFEMVWERGSRWGSKDMKEISENEILDFEHYKLRSYLAGQSRPYFLSDTYEAKKPKPLFRIRDVSYLDLDLKFSSVINNSDQKTKDLLYANSKGYLITKDSQIVSSIYNQVIKELDGIKYNMEINEKFKEGRDHVKLLPGIHDKNGKEGIGKYFIMFDFLNDYRNEILEATNNRIRVTKNRETVEMDLREFLREKISEHLNDMVKDSLNYYLNTIKIVEKKKEEENFESKVERLAIERVKNNVNNNGLSQEEIIDKIEKLKPSIRIELNKEKKTNDIFSDTAQYDYYEMFAGLPLGEARKTFLLKQLLSVEDFLPYDYSNLINKKVTKDGTAEKNNFYRLLFENLIAEFVTNSYAASNDMLFVTSHPSYSVKPVYNKDGKTLDVKATIKATSENLAKRNAALMASGGAGVYYKTKYNVSVANDISVNSEMFEVYNQLLDSKSKAKYKTGDKTDAQEMITVRETLERILQEGKITPEEFIVMLKTFAPVHYQLLKGLPITKNGKKYQIIDTEELLENHPTVGIYFQKENNEILKAIESKTYSPESEVYKLAMNVQKPVQVGDEMYYIYDEQGSAHDISYSIYIKSSTIPLLEGVVNGSQLEPMLLDMYTKSISRVPFKTAVKRGAINTKDLFKKDNNGKLYYNTEFFDDNIQSISSGSYRKQLDTEFHEDETDVTASTQDNVLFNADTLDTYQYDYNGKTISGSELKDEYLNIQKEIYELKLQKLLKRIGAGIGKKNNYEFKSLQQLSDWLIEEYTKNEVDPDEKVIYALSLNSEGLFNIPLSFYNGSSTIQPKIMALMTKALLKSEMPGQPYIQGSPILLQSNEKTFEKENVSTLKDLEKDVRDKIVWVDKESKNKTDLQFVRFKTKTDVTTSDGVVIKKGTVIKLEIETDENGDPITDEVKINGETIKKVRYTLKHAGKALTDIVELLDKSERNDQEAINKIYSEWEILPAEIVIPFHFSKNGKQLDILDFVTKDGFLDSTKVPQELLEIYGFRIPYQSINSGNWFKVVGFLPRVHAHLAVVPAEIVVQMGSDFDVDKLYTYNKNYIYNSETKKLSVLTGDKNSDYADMLLNREVLNKSKLMENGEELFGINPKDEEIKDNTYIPSDTDYQIQILQDKLIDLHKSVYTSMFSILSVLDPQETDMSDLTISNFEKIREAREKLPYYYEPSSKWFGIGYPVYQTEVYFKNRFGQKMLGIFVVNSLQHVHFQNTNSFINEPFMFTLIGKDKKTITPDDTTEIQNKNFQNSVNDVNPNNYKWITKDGFGNDVIETPTHYAGVPRLNTKQFTGLWRLDKVFDVFGRKISSNFGESISISVDNPKDNKLAAVKLNMFNINTDTVFKHLGLDQFNSSIFISQPILEYVYQLLGSNTMYSDDYSYVNKEAAIEQAVLKLESIARRNNISTNVSAAWLDLTTNPNSDKQLNFENLYNYVFTNLDINPDLNTEQGIKDQLKVLYYFLKADDLSRNITSVISNSASLRGKSTKTLSENYYQSKDIEKLQADSGKILNYSDKIGKSLVSIYWNFSSFVNKLFNSSSVNGREYFIFPYESPAFRNLFSFIEKLNKLESLKPEDSNIISNEAFRYILTNPAFSLYIVHQSGLSIEEIRKSLYTDKGNIFETLEELKNQNYYEIKDNILIQLLRTLDKSESSDESKQEDSTEILNSNKYIELNDAAKDRYHEIEEAWLRAFKVDTSRDDSLILLKKFANQLLYHTFLTASNQFGHNNIIRYVPLEILKLIEYGKFANNMNISLKDPTFFDQYIDAFFHTQRAYDYTPRINLRSEDNYFDNLKGNDFKLEDGSTETRFKPKTNLETGKFYISEKYDHEEFVLPAYFRRWSYAESDNISYKLKADSEGNPYYVRMEIDRDNIETKYVWGEDNTQRIDIDKTFTGIVEDADESNNYSSLAEYIDTDRSKVVNVKTILGILRKNNNSLFKLFGFAIDPEKFSNLLSSIIIDNTLDNNGQTIGENIYINPQLIKKTSTNYEYDLARVIIHELLHIVYNNLKEDNPIKKEIEKIWNSYRKRIIEENKTENVRFKLSDSALDALYFKFVYEKYRDTRNDKDISFRTYYEGSSIINKNDIKTEFIKWIKNELPKLSKELELGFELLAEGSDLDSQINDIMNYYTNRLNQINSANGKDKDAILLQLKNNYYPFVSPSEFFSESNTNRVLQSKLKDYKSVNKNKSNNEDESLFDKLKSVFAKILKTIFKGYSGSLLTDSIEVLYSALDNIDLIPDSIKNAIPEEVKQEVRNELDVEKGISDFKNSITPISKNTDFKIKIDQFNYTLNTITGEVIHNSKKGDKLEDNETQTGKVYQQYAIANNYETKEFNKQNYVKVFDKVVNINNGNIVTMPNITLLFDKREENLKGIEKSGSIVLNYGQKEALSKFTDFLDKGINKSFLLKGRAGTGKSTIASTMMQVAKKKGFNIFATAISDAATTNLANLSKNTPGVNIEIYNFAAMYGLVPQYDDNGNMTGFDFPSADSQIESVPKIDNSNKTILIFDEASMVSLETLSKIQKRTPDITILFMGDNAQITPIGDSKISTVFDLEDQYELTEVMRQKDSSPILEIANSIAQEIDIYDNTKELDLSPILDKVYTSFNKSENSGTIITNLEEEFINEAVVDFKKYGNKQTLVITGNNDNVARLNKKIREKIVLSDKQFVVGERLMTYTKYSKYLGKGQPKLEIFNSSVINILSVTPSDVDGVPTNNISIEYVDQQGMIRRTYMNVIHKNNIEDIKQFYENKKKLNAEYKKTKDKSILDKLNNYNQTVLVDYAYAMTAHKAQGQTVRNTYVVPLYRGFSELEARRMFYTSITRPTDKLVIFDKNATEYNTINRLVNNTDTLKNKGFLNDSNENSLSLQGESENMDTNEVKTNINLTKKNLFTVKPIQSADKKALVKASVSNKYIGFAEGIEGSSTAEYAKQINEQVNNVSIVKNNWNKDSPKENPNTAYIFTENINSIGSSRVGGGSAIIRNNPNAIGIVTKKYYVYAEDRATSKVTGGWNQDFQDTEADFELFKKVNLEQFAKIDKYKNKIFPQGFASDLAKIPTRFAEWLQSELLDRYGLITELNANKTGLISKSVNGNSNIVNSGNYSSEDVVFVSIVGKRGNETIRKEQQDKTIKEALKAIENGAILITDNKSYVESSDYNEGEKRLAKNLEYKEYHYSEQIVDGEILGIWSKNPTNITVEKIEDLSNSSESIEDLSRGDEFDELTDMGELDINISDVNISNLQSYISSELIKDPSLTINEIINQYKNCH